MTRLMRCEDKDRLIAYLYGEDDPGDRVGVEAHLARCAACAEEAAALRGLRRQLTSWQAPEVDLGFRVVRDVAPAPAARGWWHVPAWAQAMAAVLVLAVAAGVSNLQVEYGSGAVTIRTGWSQPAATGAQAARGTDAATATRTVAPDTSGPGWQAALASTEQRLRAEFAGRAAAPAQAVAGASGRTDDLLRQVQTLIEQSERRQQRELAVRLTDVLRDVDTQRRADLARIDHSMGQIEGLTSEEAARQRELLNYLVRVSQRP